jgi:protein-tyrosine phosphatase
MKSILFLCLGNTCRSPLALAAWRSLQSTGRAPQDVAALSAGLLAREGAPASEYSLSIAQDWGIDMSTHHARPLSSRMVQDAGAILVMTRDQQEALSHSFKVEPNKVHLLGSFARSKMGIDDNEILDPFGGSREGYETCAKAIMNSVAGIADAINSGELKL